MDVVQQTYKENDIRVRFIEDENAAFYALKDGNEYYLCVRILIHKMDGEGKVKNHIGTYFKEFKSSVTSVLYNQFVKDFLEDPEYREKYHVEGEKWEDIISFTTKRGVNKKCQVQIERLNKRNTKSLKFKDFIKLRTYGMDGYSRLKYDHLAVEVSVFDLNLIEQTFEKEKDILTALRWTGRGLKVEHAIRKVKTDLEIQANIK